METTASTVGALGDGGRRRPSGHSRDEIVRSVYRAFSILTAFTPERPSASLSELARQSDLPVSTASRLLATLESLSFVRRLSSGSYGLGVRVLQLGFAARQTFDIIGISEPFLVQLNEATEENTNLGVRTDAEQFTYVHQIPSRHPVRHASWVGKIQPIKGTANGAALMGNVGKQGYVATRRTIELDVSAVAAPVRGVGGEVVASISITAPTYRVSDDQLSRYGMLVADAARSISRAIRSG